MVYPIIIPLFTEFYGSQELPTGAGFPPSTVCYTIEIYNSVRKESDEIGPFRKGPCETCAHGDVLHGNAWLNTLTLRSNP